MASPSLPKRGALFQKGLLNFTVSWPEGNRGFFDAAIAKSLLHGQAVVLIDELERPASVTQDANFWYIHVTYLHSQHHVTIGGSNTVTEFPSVPLLAIVLMLAIVIFTRRTQTLTRRRQSSPIGANRRVGRGRTRGKRIGPRPRSTRAPAYRISRLATSSKRRPNQGR